MLCLLWLLSSAPASLRYSNARSRIAKSGPIPSRARCAAPPPQRNEEISKGLSKMNSF